MQRTIDRLVEGRTTFVVAHRLSTLRNADRILVLDRGECVGLGSHEELLASCPLYRQMWETQQLSDATPRRVAGAPSAQADRLEEGEFAVPGDDIPV